jgi:hypothetical protein
MTILGSTGYCWAVHGSTGQDRTPHHTSIRPSWPLETWGWCQLPVAWHVCMVNCCTCKESEGVHALQHVGM